MSSAWPMFSFIFFDSQSPKPASIHVAGVRRQTQTGGHGRRVRVCRCTGHAKRDCRRPARRRLGQQRDTAERLAIRCKSYPASDTCRARAPQHGRLHARTPRVPGMSLRPVCICVCVWPGQCAGTVCPFTARGLVHARPRIRCGMRPLLSYAYADGQCDPYFPRKHARAGAISDPRPHKPSPPYQRASVARQRAAAWASSPTSSASPRLTPGLLALILSSWLVNT